jgi:hypothetical protein
MRLHQQHISGPGKDRSHGRLNADRLCRRLPSMD